MKLTLRDLFWLTLLVASLTVWVTEHLNAQREIRRTSSDAWFVKTDQAATPGELQRQSVVERLGRSSDEQLVDGLRSWLWPTGGCPIREDDYEPHLVEMTRRGLDEPLRRLYEKWMADNTERTGFQFPHNLELLTALRRAEGQRDPLILRVEVSDRIPGSDKWPGPYVSASVENVDAEQEAVYFLDGCDDRGGRRERWRFLLTDLQGRPMAESNYLPWGGGGVGGFGPLQFGELGRRTNHIDLRKYIAPPPTGKYQLQALYHNSVCIARERDVSGLITSMSEPISVWVDNPTVDRVGRPLMGSRSLASIAGACGVMALVSMRWREAGRVSRWLTGYFRFQRVPAVARRDMVWIAVITMLLLGMYIDQAVSKFKLQKYRADATANWSIRLAEKNE